MVTAQESTQPYATGESGERRRAGAADGIYRQVNERIRELWRSYDFGSPMQLFCECSEPGCAAPLPVDQDRYDVVRVFEGRSIVAPEHAPAGAHVVERLPEYWVVQEQR